MAYELIGISWVKDKPGVHRLSKLRSRVIGFLLGDGGKVALETMVASAKDIEVARQDLLYLHVRQQAVTSGERELIYRLIRMAHSYGFRYRGQSREGLAQRNFTFSRAEQAHCISINLEGWPHKLRLGLTTGCVVSQCEGDLLSEREVNRPEDVAAYFVQLCELSLQHHHYA